MGVSCRCGSLDIREKWRNWNERGDKEHFYWTCLICRSNFKTRRHWMQFTDNELKELKWAVHVATDGLKRVIDTVREEKGLNPTNEVMDKMTTLYGLMERFGPMD